MILRHSDLIAALTSRQIIPEYSLSMSSASAGISRKRQQKAVIDRFIFFLQIYICASDRLANHKKEIAIFSFSYKLKFILGMQRFILL